MGVTTTEKDGFAAGLRRARIARDGVRNAPP
jgi:hypothetical protein